MSLLIALYASIGVILFVAQITEFFLTNEKRPRIFQATVMGLLWPVVLILAMIGIARNYFK